MKARHIAAVLLAVVILSTIVLAGADPLPSWNDGQAKSSIVAFVEKVTTKDGPDFVPVEERIATFDNDGCLWSEQPMYFQAFFVFDRIKALAPQHPEWKDQEPFASVLDGHAPLLAEARGARRLVDGSETGDGEIRRDK